MRIIESNPSVSLVWIDENPEWRIAYARGVCHRRKPDDDPRRAIHSILSTGHLSCLEHAGATFEVQCSRVTSHQIVRHRGLSILQESQRSTQSEMFVHLPKAMCNDSSIAFGKLIERLEETMQFYQQLVQAGMRLEDARYILPSCCMTNMILTGNMRSWLHFLRLRLHPSAQREIRMVAEQIQETLVGPCPTLFSKSAIANFRYAPETGY